jgi:hypothetical protein
MHKPCVIVPPRPARVLTPRFIKRLAETKLPGSFDVGPLADLTELARAGQFGIKHAPERKGEICRAIACRDKTSMAVLLINIVNDKRLFPVHDMYVDEGDEPWEYGIPVEVMGWDPYEQGPEDTFAAVSAIIALHGDADSDLMQSAIDYLRDKHGVNIEMETNGMRFDMEVTAAYLERHPLPGVWKPLGFAIKYAMGNTGCSFLDYNYTMLAESGEIVPWSDLECLTAVWKPVRPRFEAACDLFRYIEKVGASRLRELIRIVCETNEKMRCRPRRTGKKREKKR